MRFSTLALMMGLSFGAMQPACADVYTYTDDNGVVHLSNVPSGGDYKVYLRDPAAPAKAAADSPRGKARHGGRRKYDALVSQVAQQEQLDPLLVHAVIAAESGYNPNALSPKGAVGLMQVMPATGQRFGIADLKNPESNIRAGSRYLRSLLALFGQDIKLAIAAYNAGEEAVMRHGRNIPPYGETQRYVPKVLGFYRESRRG